MQARWDRVAEHCEALLNVETSPKQLIHVRAILINAYCKLLKFEEAEALLRQFDEEANQLEWLWANATLADARRNRADLRLLLERMELSYPEQCGTDRYKALRRGLGGEHPDHRLSSTEIIALPAENVRELLQSQSALYLGAEKRSIYLRLREKHPRNVFFLKTLGNDLAQKPEKTSDLDEALSIAEQLSKLQSDPMPSFSIAARALVGTQDVDGVARLANDISRSVGNCHLEVQLRSWLAAADEKWALASKLCAESHRMLPNFRLDLEGVDLHARSATPKHRMKDQLLLIATVKNEMVFLPWFLDYYRNIGVNWFFIVDDGSTDESLSYLLKQRDVTVFSSRQSFFETGSGIQWLNYLISKFGDNNWCLMVDADEQLVVPDIEKKGLEPVLESMTHSGETSLRAYMLDMGSFSENRYAEFKTGDNPLHYSDTFVDDVFFCGDLYAGYLKATGPGITALPYSPKREKVPLIRGGHNIYYTSSHTTTANHVARGCAALLHYKPLRTAIDLQGAEGLAAERIVNRQAICIARHKMFHHVAHGGDAHLSDDQKLKYQGSHQLKAMGLLW